MKNNTGAIGFFLVFGVIVLTVLLMVGVTILQGWVLTVLWGWFVASIFGLPQLTIPAAIGISIFINMFKSYNINRNKASSEEKIEAALISIISPFIALLLGYIVHSFM